MTDQEPDNRNPEELLDRAIASLQQQARNIVGEHDQPAPAVVHQTLERLSSALPGKPSFISFWRSIIMKPAFRLSATAVFALIVLAMFWLFALRPSMSFADVIANVSGIRSVSFKITGTVSSPGQAPQKVGGEVLVAEPARMRQVIQPPGMIQIWDYQAGKMVTLDPRNKTAIVANLSGMPQALSQMNVLDQFRRYDSKDFEQIGEKSINGRATTGFRRKGDESGSTIWVDKETRLPVLIQNSSKQGMFPGTMIEMTDFKWDVTVDEQSLSVTPPAGYQVQTMNMDVSPATEWDLVNTLQTVAQMSNNLFPEKFSIDGMMNAMDKNLKKEVADSRANAVDAKTVREKVTLLVMKATRGLMFTSNPGSGTDWHYAGKGVTLGQPNTPIMWYLPAGSAMYHVIDADLSVHEVKDSELPAVPSVPLNATATTMPTTGQATP